MPRRFEIEEGQALGLWSAAYSEEASKAERLEMVSEACGSLCGGSLETTQAVFARWAKKLLGARQ